MAKGRKEMLNQLSLMRRVKTKRIPKLKIIRTIMVVHQEPRKLNQVLIESLYPGRKPYMKQESSC